MDEIQDPSLEQTLRGHRQAINWLEFSRDGKQLVSASDDNSVMLWSLDDKQSICYRLVGHSNVVLSVAFTPQYLLSSSKDCSVRLWRLNRINSKYPENESVVYRCHSSSIRCVDANADATQFCTASDDKTVKIWSPNATNKFIATLSGLHNNWVRHAKYSKLNTHLIGSCGDDGLICIWDIRTKDAVIKLSSRRKSTHFVSLVWHPNCEHIISTSSADTSIRIWDLRQEKMIQYYAAHTGSVNSTDFHSSGNYLISASSDETCKIFDLLEGRGLFTVKAHNGPVNCATFTNDGQYFATAGNDKHIMIWKSNLLTQFNPNDTIAEIEEQINESQQKPQISQTKSTTFTKEPLKSALRQTSSSNQSKPSTSYANTDKKALSNHKINDIITIDDSVDHSISGDSFSISQGIITQLRSLTDSVLVLEERLSVLEDKFESHCSAEVVNLSND